MSDFLISCGKRFSGEDLLFLSKKPYGNRCPKGRYFDFQWGSMSVFEEHIANNGNIVSKDGYVLAWFGDLVTDMSDGYIERLISRVEYLKRCGSDNAPALASDEVFRELNGGFVVVLVNEKEIDIITDPRNFVQVYAGYNRGDNAVVFGTHQDLVAAISDDLLNIDKVSIVEYLNAMEYKPVFPNTLYCNVKQLNAGSVFNIIPNGLKTEISSLYYWLPPKELKTGYNESDLEEELRCALVNAVRKRCRGSKIAVQLSGGADSRLIMALVPKSVECIGLTFCDYPNRETRIAKKVAECYNRDWFSIIRDKESLGNSVIDVVKSVGCGAEFVSAHAMGMVDAILGYNPTMILDGMQMDVYLKGYSAEDIRRVNRFGGLLPAKYLKTSYDYPGKLAGFWKQNVVDITAQQLHDRWTCFYEQYVDLDRSSTVEWLYLHPVDSTLAGWDAERRVLPKTLIALDRHLLDFSFKCPLALKLGGKIFNRAAMHIYGAGANIPSANDGVRLGSGHWMRLAQRAVRKLQDRTASVLEKLGREQKVQHSWHNYQKYWQESRKLSQLIEEYGPNLDQFDFVLFRSRGRDLLNRKDIDWHYGFRLVQLAVWMGIIRGYKDSVRQIRSV